MNPLVKLLHIIQWVAVIISMIPFMLLGAFVVIPLALLFKADMKKLWLWGNAEEGCPDWWLKMDKPAIKDVFPRWWWFVVRNPLNNMRYMFDDTEDFDTYGWQQDSMEAHDLIAADITSASRWRRRGKLASYRRVWLNDIDTYSEFWIGWKVGSKVPGLGFATQLRLNREIGK